MTTWYPWRVGTLHWWLADDPGRRIPPSTVQKGVVSKDELDSAWFWFHPCRVM